MTTKPSDTVELRRQIDALDVADNMLIRRADALDDKLDKALAYLMSDANARQETQPWPGATWQRKE